MTDIQLGGCVMNSRRCFINKILFVWSRASLRRKGKEPNVLNPDFLIVRSNVNVELLGNSFPAGVRDSFSTAALLENLQHCCRQHNYSGAVYEGDVCWV